MSCEWCKNIKSIKDKSIWDLEADEGEIVLDEDYNKFYVVVDGWHKLKIKYCPNCGEKLEVKDA